MSDEEYAGWVNLHCQATAGGPEAARALVSEMNRRYFAEKAATAEELGECTYRLVPLRVPKFANEHAEAVARELIALRTERAAVRRTPAGGASGEPMCRFCHDTALVTVPHPLCVEVPARDPPRLVPFFDPQKGIRYTSLVEIAVRCTECPRGRGANSPHLSLVNYLRQIGGWLSADQVAELLAQHHRAEASRVRRSATRGGMDLRASLKNLLARLAHGNEEGTDAS